MPLDRSCRNHPAAALRRVRSQLIVHVHLRRCIESRCPWTRSEDGHRGFSIVWKSAVLDGSTNVFCGWKGTIPIRLPTSGSGSSLMCPPCVQRYETWATSQVLMDPASYVACMNSYAQTEETLFTTLRSLAVAWFPVPKCRPA